MQQPGKERNSRKRLQCEDYSFVREARKKYKKYWNSNFTETNVLKLLSLVSKNFLVHINFLVMYHIQYMIYSEYINIFRSLIGRISFRIGITLETFSSHHKFYIKEHEFTKSISDNYFWTTELKVQVSLETINGGQTPIPLETVVSSKAGFIRKIEVRLIQISYADVVVTKRTKNY